MTPIEAAGLWIGLQILVLLFVSGYVGKTRASAKVSLGDGGNEELLRAIRAQGNYIEYAPGACLGLLVIAMLGGNIVLIHVLGLTFLVARIAHMLGLGMNLFAQGRVVGAVLTMLVLLVTALAVLFYAIT